MSRGFSLLEACIATFIVTLLFSVFLPPLVSVSIRNDERDTQADLEEARIALVGFAMVHRRIPCPGDGFEQPCGLQVAEGTLPWKTLGLPAGTDRFGNPLLYRVDPAYTVPVTLDRRCSADGAITFKSRSGTTLHEEIGLTAGMTCYVPDTGSCSCEIAPQRPIAVIFSAGANGQLEGENAVFRPVRPVYQEAGDDITTWISPHYLKGWLVRAGKAP